MGVSGVANLTSLAAVLKKMSRLMLSCRAAMWWIFQSGILTGKAAVCSKGRFSEREGSRGFRGSRRSGSPKFPMDSRGKVSSVLLPMGVGDVGDDADFVWGNSVSVLVFDLDFPSL